MIKNLLARNSLMFLYTLVLIGLIYGVYVTSGSKYFGGVFLYGFSLLVFYVLFNLPSVNRLMFERLKLPSLLKFNFSIYWLLIPTVLIIIVHLTMLGGIPTLKALDYTYIEDVADYRNSITYDSPKWILYLASISLKSSLPFIILYLLYKDIKWLYWIILIVGAIYSVSLIQKSFIVGLVLPAMVYCVVKRRYLFVAKYLAMIFIGVIGLTYAGNPPGGNDPNRRNGPSTVVMDEEGNPITVNSKQVTLITDETSKLGRIVLGLVDRLFVVPGQVVSDWFEVIPEKKPFLYGDGYRVLAMIRGRTYHNYARELYPIIQTEFAAMGLTGSVNVASFMYEYSNFGMPGLVLSGFLLALVLSWVEYFFRNDLILKLCLCMFPIFMLSSGAITTWLFSGGFGFTLLYFAIFLRKKNV
ncbi:MAG: hypothetical protein IPM77_15465 [Crocinitomicaceae bacterium]|nr:hypothetical protein [Crocinitomicaceae bacterium]MBL7897654.1 hypothetical protein [Crocinitomicaceae bacterium]